MQQQETSMALEGLLKQAYEAGRRDAAPVQPVSDYPSPDLKLNANGDPEFASIVIQMDHLLRKDNGHFTVKTVMSTETAEQALRSLLDYYDEDSAVFKLESTIDLLWEYRQSPENGIFLYMPPVPDSQGQPILQAIISTPAFAAMVHHPDYGNGSQFVCTSKLIVAFEEIMEGTKKRHGAYVPLTFLRLDQMLKSTVDRAEAQTAG